MTEPEDRLPERDESEDADSFNSDRNTENGDTTRSGNEASLPLSAEDLGRAFAQLMGESDSVDDDVLSDSLAGGSSDEESTDEESTDADQPEETERPVEDATPVSPESILEAMLFVGHPENVPLTNRLLASFMRGVSPTEIDEMVADLNRDYDQQHTAYQIISDGDGYRLALRSELDHIRNNFYGKIKEVKMSQSAIDVLSIVAYNQPAERKTIEDVLGKPVGSILGQLVRRNLLSLEKTTERPRKTFYRTTDRFLQLFGIESVDDLPRGENF